MSCQADANGSSEHDLKLFTSAKVISQRLLGSSLQFDKIISTDLQARADSKGAMTSTPLLGEVWFLLQDAEALRETSCGLEAVSAAGLRGGWTFS